MKRSKTTKALAVFTIVGLLIAALAPLVVVIGGLS